MNCLKAIDLQKQYKARKVVKNVSLQIRNGEIVGLLGPNGAGKTTSFYMMVGIISSDAGKVLLMIMTLPVRLCTNAHAWGLVIYHKNLPFFAN